jgi:pilus assembly protein Flp/PilA
MLTTPPNAGYCIGFCVRFNSDEISAGYGPGTIQTVLKMPLGQLRQPRVDLRSQLMKTLFSRFVKDESGATAIEYGLIAAGISVAIIAVVQGLGSKLNTTFSSVSGALK